MENIVKPTGSFNFNTLSLGDLTGIQGGAYFTRLYNNGNALYIQTPKTLTKQGVVRTDKKVYIDLMFSNTDKQIIEWLENLETRCHELIFQKADDWFAKKQTLSEIESAFASPIRIYKSGKYYLVRLNVKLNTITNTTSVKLYNESQEPQTIYDITHDTHIISIIEITGIKFTSQNFQLEMELKQAMLMNPEKLFDNCLINPNENESKTTNEKDSLLEVESLDLKEDDTIPLSKVSEESDEERKNKRIQELEALSERIIRENKEVESKLNRDETDSVDKHDDESSAAGYDDDATIATGTEESVGSEEDVSEEGSDYESEYESDDENKPVKRLQLGEEINLDSTSNNELDKNNDHLEEVDLFIKPSIDIPAEEISLENSDELKEVNVTIDTTNTNTSDLEPISLKKSHNVHMEIYKQALKKAKLLKQEFVLASLEAKNIKNTYLLEDVEESDEDELNIENMEDIFD